VTAVYRLLHVVTVGTSLVRNASGVCDRVPGLRGFCDLLKSWSNASPDSSEDLEASRSAIPPSPVFKALLEALAGDPRRLSAELNALFGYLDTLRGPCEHHVVLLSSDTGVGWLCARVLEEFLKPMERVPEVYARGEHSVESVEALRVPLLGRDFVKGSLNLVREVKKAIKRWGEKVDEVLFNATGGYKPETGFLLLVAGLVGASRVYYIHETMREVVEIPVLPVKVSEPLKGVLERAARGEQLSPVDYQVLREHRVLRPGEKEPAWLQELAKILLD
jgi:putative CRISPR-associated protein (TIGR02619 family)